MAKTETDDPVIQISDPDAPPPLDKLAAALVKVQAELDPVPKGQKADAGQYSYTYADLASVWRAIRPLTTKHGIAVVQMAERSTGGTVSVTTTLLHTSGQSVSSTLELEVAKATPQGVGTAISYARRYALCALVGVSTEDTDAVEHEQPAQTGHAPAARTWSDDADPVGGPTPVNPDSSAPVTVQKVEIFEGISKKNGKAFTKYNVVFSNGEQGSTFDGDIGLKATAYREDQTHVEYALKPPSNPKYNPDLVMIDALPDLDHDLPFLTE